MKRIKWPKPSWGSSVILRHLPVSLILIYLLDEQITQSCSLLGSKNQIFGLPMRANFANWTVLTKDQVFWLEDAGNLANAVLPK